MNFKPTPIKKVIADIEGSEILEIFAEIKEHGNAQGAFLSGLGFEPSHIKMVDEEGDRLFNLVKLIASGKYVIQEEVSHIDEDTGEKVIDTPLEYYTPTTKTDFKSQFNSSFADDTFILREVVEHEGFNYNTQFDEFLKAMQNVE